jgi:putative copper export protein
LFLLPFLEWCEGLAVSQAYRESLWLFTLTQCLHLVAISTFIGAILIVDLRLLGWGPVRQSRARIARSAQPILLWAGLAVLATGIPQFTTNALSYSRSPVFVFKMGLLVATLVFTATVRRRVALADEGGLPSWVTRAVGAVSLALWMGVTIGGRFIAFYG